MTRRLVKLAEVETQAGYAWANKRWLQRQIYDRRLAWHKISGRLLIDLDDLDKLAEQGRREPASHVRCPAKSSGGRRRSKAVQGAGDV